MNPEQAPPPISSQTPLQKSDFALEGSIGIKATPPPEATKPPITPLMFDDFPLPDPCAMAAELAESEQPYEWEESWNDEEREVLFDDLASDNDDYAHAQEDGWFYSDEDPEIDSYADSGDWDY